ncbi:MAG: GNAT family N-acetyltransferase [Oscillospiraceae bacterium]|nr:GNAT family N-acetyltransferase [Oscillospiraceae bacterium]
MRRSEAFVRAATENDYAAIQKVNLGAFGYDFSKEKTAERLSEILRKPNDKVFVVDFGGITVGYIHGSDYDCTYSPPLKNILALGVLPEFQGQGLGRMLVDALEQWARDDGCAGVRLVSGFNRADAHKFYLSLGYTDRKDQKNFIKMF